MAGDMLRVTLHTSTLPRKKGNGPEGRRRGLLTTQKVEVQPVQTGREAEGHKTLSPSSWRACPAYCHDRAMQLRNEHACKNKVQEKDEVAQGVQEIREPEKTS